MGFSREEYWSGLPCPPPGDLPKSGIDLISMPSFWLWRQGGSLHCRWVHYHWATWKLQCIQLSQLLNYTVYMAIAFTYKYATIVSAHSLSCVQIFAALWTIAHQAPLSMGFSRQEYWNRVSFPTPGDLPNSGIEPSSLVSPTLAGRLFILAPPGKPHTSKKVIKL